VVSACKGLPAVLKLFETQVLSQLAPTALRNDLGPGERQSVSSSEAVEAGIERNEC
jgi:hypothetical protein